MPAPSRSEPELGSKALRGEGLTRSLENIDLFRRDVLPTSRGSRSSRNGGEIVVPMSRRCYDAKPSVDLSTLDQLL
jgi:hypothetical protein